MLTTEHLEMLKEGKFTPDQILIVSKIIDGCNSNNVTSVTVTRNSRAGYMVGYRRRKKQQLSESVTESVTVTQPNIDHACARLEEPFLLTSQESKKESKKRKNNKKEICYSQDFENFWQAYPKNNGSKLSASEKYQVAEKLGISPAVLIAGAKRYAAQCVTDATEIHYIAHAATWLHQRRWEVSYQASEAPPGYRNGNTSGIKILDDPMNRMPSVAGG